MQAPLGAMYFKMGGVDHHGVGSCFRRPAPEAILQGLVRALCSRHAAPHQPTQDDMGNAADHPLVIALRYSTRLFGQK
jgi:hypothetical protein